MGEWIQLTADDGHDLAAYEADPGDAARGLVVIQEIFGVNDHIRDVVDRFAGHGFRALAPALFDRVETGVELGYDEAGVAEGRQIRSKLAWEDAVTDVAAAIEHLSATGPVAVVGYCFGGSMAFLAATRLDPIAAVGYYGGQIAQFVEETPRCPLLLHFGETDGAIPLDDVDKINAACPDATVHVYPGAGHGFNCDRRGSYHEPSATLALERTLAFLDGVMQ